MENLSDFVWDLNLRPHEYGATIITTTRSISTNLESKRCTWEIMYQFLLQLFIQISGFQFW